MSKFLVLPSYSENFGNVVIEAMICGSVPITTTDIPWEELNRNQRWILIVREKI